MDQISPYLKDVMGYAAENIIATPAEFSEVNVNINLGAKVLTTYVEELYSNLAMAVRLKGGEIRFDEGTLKKYVNTLIRERVKYVRGERVIIGPTERVVVPSYLSCVLSNVGKARHLDYGVELTPKLTDGEFEFMDDKTEILTFSNGLKLLKGIGFEYAEGYTRDRDGSFEFMTFSLMDGVVKSISKDPHPVYALLSSTLSVRGIETVLLPRISYGSENHLAGLVRTLASLKV
jgi:hypothetical protein